jgi:capsular polysaccharide biosynthesis protein
MLTSADEGLHDDRDRRGHPGIADILRATMRWRKRYVLGGALITAGLAFAFASTHAPVYSASESVVVEPSPLITPTLPPNMSTEAAVGDSLVVAEGVRRNTHSRETPAELLRGLSVSVPVGSEVLTFAYDSTDPTVARRFADAFARAYLQYRQSLFAKQTANSAARAQHQVSKLTKELSTLRTQAASRTGKGKAVINARAGQVAAQIGLLRQSLLTLYSAPTVPGGQLGAGQVPRSPIRPNKKLDLIAGLLLGCLIGLAGGAVREYREDRLRSPEDIQNALGAPVLASVELANRGAAADELEEGLEVQSEIRRLPSRLLQPNGAALASILFTGIELPAIRTQSVALAAVRTLASQNQRVVLISADLHRPVFAQATGARTDVSLVETLLTDTPVWQAESGSAIPHLWVIDGQAAENVARGELAASALTSLRADEIVREIRAASGGLVCVAAPNTTAVDEGLVWAHACRAVVVVAEQGKTTGRGLAGLAGDLRATRADIAGVVVIRQSRRRVRPWFRPKPATARADRSRPSPGLSRDHGAAQQQAGGGRSG